MTWEAAAVPEVAAAAGDAVGTAAVERGAASCSFSTSSSNGRVAAATCAPSHASHSLQTVANCVRHSLGCRSRRRRAAPSSGFQPALQRRRKTQISRVALETLRSNSSRTHSESHLRGAALVKAPNINLNRYHKLH